MAPIILAFLLLAQAADPGLNPNLITENPVKGEPLDYKLKFEVVLAQRKFMEVQPAYAAALKEMQAKTAEAQKACEAQGKMFSELAVTCVEKPATAPAK